MVLKCQNICRAFDVIPVSAFDAVSAFDVILSGRKAGKGLARAITASCATPYALDELGMKFG